MQYQTTKAKNSNIGEIELCDTKNILSRSNMKLPRL